MRLWVYSISASVIWETHLHSNKDIYTPGHVSLSTAADCSRSHDLKSRRCEIVSLESLTRVSGCQEGSMLSSSIAAETHVKVRSDQIKYSPHSFESLYDKIISDIEKGLCPGDFAHYIYINIYIYNVGNGHIHCHWSNAGLVWYNPMWHWSLIRWIDPYDKILIW